VLTRVDEVIAPPIEALHLRAGWHGDEEILAAAPVPLLALPVSPAPGAEMPPPVKRGKIAARGVGFKDDVTSASPVAAVWPSAWHVGLASKADAAVAATPALDVDLGPVVEHAGEVRSSSGAKSAHTAGNAPFDAWER
jgi:hypothetical protein